ncbi:MAG: hypothetical protein VKI83_09860 [Synechococcaceae cyanobacterium]|nr:hypothetical protein [Synechococcaceae cyanobacterium]
MTNLQGGGARLSPTALRQLWLGLPIAAGTLLAALVTGFLLVPNWLSLQQDSERLRALEAFREEVTLLRSQLRNLDETETRAQAQKTKLISLVTGSGDLSTLLAKLDQAASSAGVQLDLYQPAAPPAPPSGQPPAAGQARQKIEIDPLEQEGLQLTNLLVSVRGSFPQLLTFLRQLENFNLLVTQSDLNLSLETPPGAGDPKKPQIQSPVVLKLSFGVYGRKASPASPAAAQAAAGAPAAAPNAASAPAAPNAAPAAAPVPPPPGAPAANPAANPAAVPPAVQRGATPAPRP